MGATKRNNCKYCTYKQYARPILEYACPAWAPIVSESNITKLQSIQNTALRCGTGHTKDKPRTTSMASQTDALPPGGQDPNPGLVTDGHTHTQTDRQTDGLKR